MFVRVITHTLGITCIYIQPSLNSYNKTGGLCGLWNDDSEDDLYILNKNNKRIIIDDLTDETNLVRLGLFWRFDDCFVVEN